LARSTAKNDVYGGFAKLGRFSDVGACKFRRICANGRTARKVELVDCAMHRVDLCCGYNVKARLFESKR